MAGRAEPGRLIGGRYRLLARLGAGGMGQVWRASDEALRIDVAVKEVWLPTAGGMDAEERLRRAEREARNAARLRDHPNVVAVHDVVVEDGVPWTVMQLVAGHSLQEHVEKFGPLRVDHAALVAAALLDALEAAHAAGIVHRDVKPANVMLADDGKVLLTDFGIAIGHTDTALTAAGNLLGSVEYIAPERARGTEGLPASDLFSLGVTLFQAVEGFSPFHRETATGTLTAVILDEAPDPVRAGRLAPLILGLLEKEPAARVGIAQGRRLLAAREVAVEMPPTPPTTSTTPTTPKPPKPPTPASTASPDTGSAHRHGGAPGRGTTGASQHSASQHSTPPRRPTVGSPRRPTDAGKRPSQGTGKGASTASGSNSISPRHTTDQRRRIPPPEPADRRRQPPITDPRRSTGTVQRPHAPAPPARPARGPARVRARAVILVLLVVATVGGVLAAKMGHAASFTVTGVKVGDFVKVDAAGHITGKTTQPKAAGSADGRRVTAREDRADPEICKRLHVAGRADVETQHAISFCLVRPAEAATAPAR
ncbi:serine/threonine protein kinase [Catenulispora acidiphila DSM 44928]|uniref:non-specific serine/threonine protein kinase n=1 Tax=Catenulispora acidiphila (strain DSM 44928 / JCM 14897 / NBRC 102108 / NRRL B-24433 / ID139908) TaxID=479433 RepID=C7Q4P6_CATAD|nr:serine/threonine-protein kinase [Catenulispora acidiphila]ACU72015.1 serine/threonine protein kinase [Catenulispora acidiphila DSM 44928]